MRLRPLILTGLLAITAEAVACSVPSGDSPGVTAQVMTFASIVWMIGLLGTIGFWLLTKPTRRRASFAAASCLVPLVVNLAAPSFIADCGVSGAMFTVLWLFAQLGLIAWAFVHRNNAGVGR